MSRTLFLKKIEQRDNFHFSILWSDGKKMLYRLSSLQKSCPCALCKESKDIGRSNAVEEDVRALSVESVGRYAIKIRFSKGCSLGIYDFDLLYSLGKEFS